MRDVLFNQQQPRRERTLACCARCGKTTEHVKEAGAREFRCEPCEQRQRREAQKQEASGI